MLDRMIHVRLPVILRQSGAAAEFSITDSPITLGEFIKILDRQLPGLIKQLDESLYNFAVNDVLVMHGVRHHPLMPGDTVEIIPTISGGKRTLVRQVRRVQRTNELTLATFIN
jgi:molybdopterin converting factor small subunit